jgi:uncharacterized protein (DUF2225 family)
MPEEVSFYSKNDIECPVCKTAFKREELLTGRGRQNAGDLTNELRRTYLPTQKFGTVTPLIYPMTVCPNCLFAADDFDFMSLRPKAIPNITNFKTVRATYMMKVFDKVPDFSERRNFTTGTASYILAISCYPFFDKKKFSPTIKIAIYSLRTAWLLTDLFAETKDPRYQDLSRLFYNKSSEFYDTALINQSKAVEPLDGCKNLGPDTDKNYGYDGLLYVNALLKFKNAHLVEDPYEKLKLYEEVKRNISKVFGMGKKAKNKPEVLLAFAKEIYDKLADEISGLRTSLGTMDSGEESPEEDDEEDEKQQ